LPDSFNSKIFVLDVETADIQQRLADFGAVVVSTLSSVVSVFVTDERPLQALHSCTRRAACLQAAARKQIGTPVKTMKSRFQQATELHIMIWSYRELEQELVRFERVAAPYDPVQELGVSKYPRIILADRSGRYAPLFKDFIPNPDGSPTVPTLYENAPRGGSPFINPSKDPRTNNEDAPFLIKYYSTVSVARYRSVQP